MTIGLYFRQKVCAFGYALPKQVDALICPVGFLRINPSTTTILLFGEGYEKC